MLVMAVLMLKPTLTVVLAKMTSNVHFFLMSCPLRFESSIFNPVQIKTLPCSDAPSLAV